MQVSIDSETLGSLLTHATLAARLVGHLDDEGRSALIGQLGDHIDAVVHGLTEILGNPHALVPDDAAAPAVARDAAPMITSSAGGAP